MSPSPTRQGFTLVELLVVITVIAILASMLVPAVGLVRERANQQACAKNQNQIITACIAYSGDFDSPWPLGESGVKLASVANAADASKITARSFEVLAATMQLPNGLFKCKSAAIAGPSAKPRVDTTSDVWGTGATKDRVSYSFDWAAPGDPSAIRVMTSDRLLGHHKNDLVMAAYGDGHSRALKKEKSGAGSGTNITDGYVGPPVFNPDSKGTDDDTATTDDNIFDENGDTTGGLTGLKVAGASSRRAWVK